MKPIRSMAALAMSAISAMPASGPSGRPSARRLVSVEDLLDIFARLAIGRHAAVSLHRPRARVVRGERALEVALVLLQEGVQVAGPAVEVGRGVERVGHPQLARGA